MSTCYVDRENASACSTHPGLVHAQRLEEVTEAIDHGRTVLDPDGDALISVTGTEPDGNGELFVNFRCHGYTSIYQQQVWRLRVAEQPLTPEDEEKAVASILASTLLVPTTPTPRTVTVELDALADLMEFARRVMVRVGKQPDPQEAFDALNGLEEQVRLGVSNPDWTCYSHKEE